MSLDPARTFAMTRLPLAVMRDIRRATGTTLNDVYLTVCAGALRAYLAERGELPTRPLVASVPVSTDPDAARGCRATGWTTSTCRSAPTSPTR